MEQFCKEAIWRQTATIQNPICKILLPDVAKHTTIADKELKEQQKMEEAELSGDPGKWKMAHNARSPARRLGCYCFCLQRVPLPRGDHRVVGKQKTGGASISIHRATRQQRVPKEPTRG